MIEKYPADTDLIEIITNKISLNNSREFFKSFGMCFITNNRSDIAHYGSRFLFGITDFEKLKEISEVRRNYRRISGIELKVSTSLNDVFNNLSENNDILDETSSLKISDLVQKDENNLTGKIKYTKKHIGTVDLLREEKRECTFNIEETDSKKMLLIYHDSNEDFSKTVQAIEMVSENLTESNTIEPFRINLEKLTLIQKIELFDRILQHSFDDWDLNDVISCKIRRGEDLPDSDIPDEDLKGIKEAFLRGENLRTNETVKKFERSNYYFSAMTIKLTHKEEPDIIHLEIYFKTKPDIPEIKINKSFELVDEEEIRHIIPQDQQKEILKYFWNLVQNKFFELYNGINED